MDKNRLLKDIESLRNELHTTAANFGISSAQTLRISRKLDKKINSYNRAVHQTVKAIAAKQ